MHDLKHPCRIPADGEIASIPGPDPDSAIRVRLLPAQGVVLLEQMRHSRSAGWYVQKSFTIPECMLHSVLREMRKADCMVGRPSRPATVTPTTHLRLRLD